MNRISLSLLIILALACVAYSEDKTCAKLEAADSDWKCNTKTSCCGYKVADGNYLHQCCKEYQKCCQGSCCDKLSEMCITTRNTDEDKKNRQYCSSLEAVDPVAGMKLVIPPATGIFSLTVTFIYLFYSASFKNLKATKRTALFVTLTIVNFAILGAITFSPSWHYSFLGLVLLGVSFYLVGHADQYGEKGLVISAGLQALFAALVVGLLPFIGTNVSNNANRGIFTAYTISNTNVPTDYTATYCVAYYNFFTRDPKLINEYKEFTNWSWGYCQPGWLAALILLSLVMVGCVIINAIITLNLAHSKPTPKSEKKDEVDHSKDAHNTTGSAGTPSNTVEHK
jgi:hypothetical protein